MEDRRGERLSADPIELAAGEARALISPLGAEAISWRVGDRDLLWTRSTGHWDRVAPILFPCVGWSRDGRILVDGREYPMPVHGFAPACAFDVVGRDGARVLLELASGERTRAQYPFEFRLRAEYELEPDALRIALVVSNEGGAPMPYACGLHPGFSWPLCGGDGSGHRIIFEAEESPQVPVISPGGLFTARTRSVPLDGRRLDLDPALFAQEALCFLHARSRAVTFEGPGGAITAQAEGFGHWALWSRPGAPFLCVEAWTGHGDPDGFAGDFRRKPSIDLLAPGESRSHALTLRFSGS